MRGNPSTLQIKGHTKTQKAPSDIFRRLFPYANLTEAKPGLTPAISLDFKKNGVYSFST